MAVQWIVLAAVVTLPKGTFTLQGTTSIRLPQQAQRFWQRSALLKGLWCIRSSSLATAGSVNAPRSVGGLAVPPVRRLRQGAALLGQRRMIGQPVSCWRACACTDYGAPASVEIYLLSSGSPQRLGTMRLARQTQKGRMPWARPEVRRCG